MLDFSRFEVITFDCYGTLIDWESGILSALRDALHPNATDEELLRLYSEMEPEVQAASYKRYRDVLHDVLARIAKATGSEIPAGRHHALAESLPHWRPFRDTVPALRRLKAQYALGIISNIDNDLFAATARHLGVAFDYVITAEQVRSYKPSPKNFEAAIARIAKPKEKLLHVAESLFHDVAPARQLGIASVWINRRQGKPAATRHVEATPDLEVPNLTALAELAWSK
jgi:2-haloacid dehalogenase